MDDNPKLERIKEMLADDIVVHGKKAIIFSCWETTANIYRKALKEYNPAYIKTMERRTVEPLILC